ncbi:DNA (cytosine-5-)-methyltransferase N-terminal subunit [Mycoplasma procyoni]|uniref:DNA (cytosine-5-)-methyltransferase N-terminal subunit n=1 Tax=Mycoplasma procyoni TaxID=568784 RepID=UPI00197B7130|nr:DNA (cytosine-5-)-methyltransferase [Mycoplasma procyoni]MBN3534965.1 DNA (cytosine-5-)-methyltransferase [Mycoplasma procyoni]
MNRKIRLFEFFAGIGSQAKALKNIQKEFNFSFEDAGQCEFYIDAIISYMIIHHGQLKPETKLTKEQMASRLSKYSFSADSKSLVSETYFQKMKEQKLAAIYPYLISFVENTELIKRYKLIEQRERERESWTDITQFSTLAKDIDILTYSFPCQDLSQQGKQKGMTKETRSGLLFQIERILKSNLDKLPKVLVLENVKALASSKFIHEFEQWIEVLKEIGYTSSWKVVNSADYGSAQNRERVFMVSVLGNHKFEFPKETKNNKTLRDIWNPKIEHKTIDLPFETVIKTKTITQSNIHKSFLENYTKFNSENYVYYLDGKGPTLTASGANSRIKILTENQIQLLSWQEAYLYMGFEKEDIKKIQNTEILSDSRLIFTAGNSISVEVLEAIFKKLIEDGVLWEK